MVRWLAIAVCLFAAGCGTAPVSAPVGDHSARPARIPAHHRVHQGDTLYSIAWQYGFTVEQIAAWNGLSPPYRIFKGQTLRLRPPVKRRVAASASRPKPRPRPPAARVTPSRPKPAHAAAAPVPARTSPTTAAPRRSPEPGGKPHWRWPADGRLITRFNASLPGKKGVDIAGRSGDPVRAAAAGKVVYAGSGLAGYGRLIIIKHNQYFLSAYAHNRKLIAREGQWVKAGQLIALMGNSGTDRTLLHFEIRKNGSPVDPLRYLPRR